MSKNKEFADLYGPYIYVCDLHPTKILDQTKIHSINSPEYEFATKLMKKQRRYRLHVDNGVFVINLDVVPPQKAFDLLLEFGYDAVLYDAKYGSVALHGFRVNHRSISMCMLKPEQIELLELKHDNRNHGVVGKDEITDRTTRKSP